MLTFVSLSSARERYLRGRRGKGEGEEGAGGGAGAAGAGAGSGAGAADSASALAAELGAAAAGAADAADDEVAMVNDGERIIQPLPVAAPQYLLNCAWTCAAHAGRDSVLSDVSGSRSPSPVIIWRPTARGSFLLLGP